MIFLKLGQWGTSGRGGSPGSGVGGGGPPGGGGSDGGGDGDGYDDDDDAEEFVGDDSDNEGENEMVVLDPDHVGQLSLIQIT